MRLARIARFVPTCTRKFRSATHWAVLGRKEYGPKDLTIRACAGILEIGFRELGLQAINAWTVEVNRPARRALERLHFRLMGRQRRCHYINGKAYDRLLYDLLAEEFRGYRELPGKSSDRSPAPASPGSRTAGWPLHT
jgi:RimJ/RimL family protein N-acetyltransferase